jgi:hypothetical protein
MSECCGWGCPCGREPPKRPGAPRPVRTLVSMREPSCPFCGRKYREEWQVEGGGRDGRGLTSPERLAELAAVAAGPPAGEDATLAEVAPLLAEGVLVEDERAQFGPGQQARAVALIEVMAWGDMDYAIRDVETALRLAMDATRAEFLRWEEDLGPLFEAEGWEEFSVPATQVEELSDRDKLAYVARLLRTLACSYGVDPGFGYLVPGESLLERYDRLEHAHASSPAALLNGLNDISWTP